MTEIEFLVLSTLSKGEELTQDEIWKIIEQHAKFRTNSRLVAETLSVFKIKDKYITPVNKLLPPEIFKINEKGLSAYFHNKQLKERAAEEKELNFKKLKYDVKNAERVYKTYSVTRVFAWIGFVSGVILLLLKVAEVLKLLPYHK